MDDITRAQMQEYANFAGIHDYPEAEKFEHFTAFCIISSHYTDDFDVESQVVGGGNDLNVDSFAIKINGIIVNDVIEATELLRSTKNVEIEFIIVQSKTSSKFKTEPIIALGEKLAGQVFSHTQDISPNTDIKNLIRIKDVIYKSAAKFKNNPTIHVYYACTGTWAGNQDQDAAKNGVVEKLKSTNLFSNIEFHPVGATEIQQLYRKTKSTISKTIAFEKVVNLPAIDEVTASYLGVLPGEEFLKLISDDNGEIIKSVFIDNVRDFQGENPVNKDIAKTISNNDLDQFVLRNNGITIVAKSIKVTAAQFTLEDFQIVNGCQTSHVIFENREQVTAELFVPVKLIHTESDEVAQSIVKSTNKQTKVEDYDLLALTNFQRGLEDYYSGTSGDSALYYERRTKQFSSQTDLEKGRIVGIGSQLKSYASMFLDSPHQAGRYKSTLLRFVKEKVFQEKHKPSPYYVASFAAYRFEVAIRRLPREERLIRAFKFFLLHAFRYRFEPNNYPNPDSKHVEKYCEGLLVHLTDTESSTVAFNESVRIVNKSLQELDLPLERDSAKSSALIEIVKKNAIVDRD